MTVGEFIQTVVKEVCEEYSIKHKISELTIQTLSALETNEDIEPEEDYNSNKEKIHEYIDQLYDMVYLGL